jgi:two-component system, chemotaxis family, chemotaxis protein CheY
MRILVVDDTKSVHAYLDVMFEGKEEYHLVHVYNGLDALAEISKGTDFNLVLLDWEMPGLNGVEILQKIREDDKKLPVIMVTSRNASTDLMKAIKAGANEYIMKPFTQEILFEKLENVIKMKAA